MAEQLSMHKEEDGEEEEKGGGRKGEEGSRRDQHIGGDEVALRRR